VSPLPVPRDCPRRWSAGPRRAEQPESLSIVLVPSLLEDSEPMLLTSTICPGPQQGRLPAAGRSRDDRDLPRRRAVQGSEKLSPVNQPRVARPSSLGIRPASVVLTARITMIRWWPLTCLLARLGWTRTAARDVPVIQGEIPWHHLPLAPLACPPCPTTHRSRGHRWARPWTIRGTTSRARMHPGPGHRAVLPVEDLHRRARVLAAADIEILVWTTAFAILQSTCLDQGPSSPIHQW